MCANPEIVKYHKQFFVKTIFTPEGYSRKKGVGGGTEHENGDTTNTILSFFMVQSLWIFQETPPPT